MRTTSLVLNCHWVRAGWSNNRHTYRITVPPLPPPPPQPEPELAVTTLEGVLQGLVAGGEVPEGFDLLLAELAAKPEKPAPEVEQEPQPERQAPKERQTQIQQETQPQTVEVIQPQPEPQPQTQPEPEPEPKPQLTPELVPHEPQSETEAKSNSVEEPSPMVTGPAPVISEPSSSDETRQASMAPEPTPISEASGSLESASVAGTPESPATQESASQAETEGPSEETGSGLADVTVDELLEALASADENTDEYAGILEDILNGNGMEGRTIVDEPMAGEAVADGTVVADEPIADEDGDLEALLGELAVSGENNRELAASEENGGEMTEEAFERIIKECGFDPTTVALGNLSDVQQLNIDAILTNVTEEKNKESEQKEQMEDTGPEATENMSVDEIDALLQKLNSESDGTSANNTFPEQRLENQVVPQSPQVATAPSPAKENSGLYTSENVRAILTAVFGGIGVPFMTARQAMSRPLKRPPPASNAPTPPAKRPRGPSPNVVVPSAVNQLQGIVQTSVNIIRQPPSTMPLSPAYVASFGNLEDMNRRLMAMKPPPYRPRGGTPRSTHSASSAPIPSPIPPNPLPAKPKSGENEKRIKAMGFPPLLTGVKREAD